MVKADSRSLMTVLLMLLCWGTFAAAEISVTDLKCENLIDPLGIDVTWPRMSWVLTSPERGQKQSAYQVLAASSQEALDRNRGDLR